MSEIAANAVQEVLKQTFVAGLLAAAALPMTVWGAFKAIDGDWTIACERADEGGVKLARALVGGEGGGRKGGVRLLGFSFGARLILSCLKELVRLQAEWEGRAGGVDFGDDEGVGGGSNNPSLLPPSLAAPAADGGAATAAPSRRPPPPPPRRRMPSFASRRPSCRPSSSSAAQAT